MESVFPEYDFDEEINDESELEEEIVEESHGDSIKFDFEKGDFVLEDGKPVVITGAEALLQWIEKILNTRQWRYEIEPDYGTNTKGILFSGNPKPYIKAEICRDIEECLMQHEAITEVDDFEFTDGIDASVSFTIASIYGPLEKEVALHG